MTQLRRALVVLISVTAVVTAYTPTASARTKAAVATKSTAPSRVAKSAPHASVAPIPGYWLVASDGGVFSSGGATFHGSTGAIVLNKPIVGIAATTSGTGYWMVASDGGIFSFGDATFHGSTGAMTLNKPIVGMAATRTGNGYWLVASDGGIFSFGDATFHGSTGATTLNRPIVGMSVSHSGNGYSLVASDGGIFSFGDATFHGSTGAIALNNPIVGMASTASGNGYWLVASDGGIFSFGDATFHGSTGGIALNNPIVGMAVTPSGLGYWFVAADGGVFAFGDAQPLSGAGATTLNSAVVGMAASAPSASLSPAATKLAFTTSPTGATGGVAFGTQPTVTVQDASGATVTTDTSSVTLAITTPAGGSVLTCTNNPKATNLGVAAFAACNINRPGTYTLTATDGASTPAVSASTTITIGPAAKLGFTNTPSGATSNVALATQPHVAVQDLGGNTIVGNTSSVTLSITTPAGAVLTCTNASPLPAVAGVATFTGCAIDKSGSYTLHATDGALTPANSSSLSITAAAATKLAFTTAASASTGGVVFPTQPVVKVQDPAGNTVLTDASGITLTITTPAGAVLTCTTATPLPAVNGVANFAGCRIDVAGTYTLHAADGVLTATTSASLTISVGAAAKVAFTTSQSASTGGVPFGTQPIVAVQDLGGNTIVGNTSSVTLTITTPAGALLTCTSASPLPAVAGVATFTGCTIDKVGTYTLHAADGALTPASSASAAVTVGAAAKLGFTVSPSATTGGVDFPTQPVVAVQDLGSNTVTTDTSSVTLTITTPGSATLTCTNASPLPVAAGLANFTGCHIDVAGTYTLHAADGALTPATSNSVTISVGAAVKLAFSTQPGASTGGVALSAQPAVAAEDLGGNIVNPTPGSVTLTITTPAGALIACTSANPLPMLAGVATFIGCNIDKAGSYTLRAVDGVHSPSTSTVVVISVGAAAKLGFTTQPSSSTTNTAFATQPVVSVQDLGGNTVTTDTSSVTLTISTPAGAILTCTNAGPLPAVAGVAAFTGCSIDLANTYTLHAADGALTVTTSTPIVIT